MLSHDVGLGGVRAANINFRSFLLLCIDPILVNTLFHVKFYHPCFSHRYLVNMGLEVALQCVT